MRFEQSSVILSLLRERSNAVYLHTEPGWQLQVGAYFHAVV
jgi:hypothetical protein